MISVIVVVAPILFVLLTTVAILSFAPLAEEEPAVSERGLKLESDEPVTLNEGAKIILFRPAAVRQKKTASADDLVAHLEQELRQRHKTALELVADSNDKSATAS